MALTWGSSRGCCRDFAGKPAASGSKTFAQRDVEESDKRFENGARVSRSRTHRRLCTIFFSLSPTGLGLALQKAVWPGTLQRNVTWTLCAA